MALLLPLKLPDSAIIFRHPSKSTPIKLCILHSSREGDCSYYHWRFESLSLLVIYEEAQISRYLC